MGSCIFQVGFQNMPGNNTTLGAFRAEGQATPRGAAAGFEYDDFGRRVYYNASFGQVFEQGIQIEAWQKARRLALGRLAEEAMLAGADAVVGVHLRRGSSAWGRNTIEFVAIGTAVVSERYDLGGEPVLSNLSGQDFAKLFASGYWPVGLVADTTVIYVMTGWQQAQSSGRLQPNQELPDFTQGVQHARRLAVSRVSRDAKELGAAGIVGLDLEIEREEQEHEGPKKNRHHRDLVVTAHALGTAIVELERRGEVPPISLVLSLNEERS